MNEMNEGQAPEYGDMNVPGEWVDENELNDEVKLPFAKAEVIRLMKQHLDADKMLRERVKRGMNLFLAEILENICIELNKYPYTTITYDMLKECIYPYKNVQRIEEEKERLIKHMDSIQADCDALKSDVKRTMKIKDVQDTIY